MTTAIQCLNIKQIMAITGLGRTTIWRRVQDKQFPAPRKLGPRRVAWLESEIQAWLKELPIVSYGQAENVESGLAAHGAVKRS